MEASSPRRMPRPAPAEESETSLVSLPSEIHEKIVSFLPVRDAVRTSAVSRAWRRIWESAPGLALDWGDEYRADPAFADDVLARYSCLVRSFFFHLPQESFQRSDDWVSLLAGKGVQTLRLHFRLGRNVEAHRMDMSIFACRELTYLQLGGCDIPAAPAGLVGFPNLTRLHLHEVGFPDNGVRGLEALIAESPLLQVLWLDKLWLPDDEIGDEPDGHEFEGWVIRAPNLRDLSIVSEYDDNGWQIEELPCIEKLEISSENYFINRDFVRILTRVARVRELSLKMPLRESSALEGLSCSFQNLKDLSLDTDFCCLSTILSTICLLKNAPNLEDLSIQICYDNRQNEEVGLDVLNAQWTDGLLAKLKSVSMDMATCESNEMHFIEFVLSKARRLEKFSICAVEHCTRSNEELLVEIIRYRRASPQAKVFFDRMEFG